MMRLFLAVLVLAVLVAGCGGDADEPASTLTKAERDSVLADSPLPGAAAVGRALDIADSSRTRAARLEELNGN